MHKRTIILFIQVKLNTMIRTNSMIYQMILLLILISCIRSTANAQWTKIPGPVLQTGTSFASTSFHIPDKTATNNYIYALTGRYENGKIYRSRDLGKKWELIFSDDSLSKLVEVKYDGDKQGLSTSDLIVINDDSIYCYKAGALAYSNNSGKTWNYRKTPNFENSSSQRGIQPNHYYDNLNPNFGVFSDGTFVGLTEDGELFKSTSNGKYWSPLILPDTSYKNKCDLNYGKLIVSGNNCLVYFPFNVNSREEINNFYYLSVDNAKSFIKYNFPRESSSIEENGYRPELKFNPLGFLNDGKQVWYRGGEFGGGYGYGSEKGLWDRKMAPEHAFIIRTRDSSQVIDLPHYSMYYVIAVQILIYGTELDNKVLLPYSGDLYCYDKIDKSVDGYSDIVNNNFDKSFLLNDPPFPNNQEGKRSCENQRLCSSFNFWSPSIDQERMVNHIKDLNDNTVQKQREREKAEQEKVKKIRSLVDWIRTSGNSTLFNFFYDGLRFKVQKVELVGDDNIRVKIVKAELFSNNKPTLYEGVKLIQGADFVINLVDLATMNK